MFPSRMGKGPSVLKSSEKVRQSSLLTLRTENMPGIVRHCSSSKSTIFVIFVIPVLIFLLSIALVISNVNLDNILSLTKGAGLRKRFDKMFSVELIFWRSRSIFVPKCR